MHGKPLGADISCHSSDRSIWGCDGNWPSDTGPRILPLLNLGSHASAPCSIGRFFFGSRGSWITCFGLRRRLEWFLDRAWTHCLNNLKSILSEISVWWKEEKRIPPPTMPIRADGGLSRRKGLGEHRTHHTADLLQAQCQQKSEPKPNLCSLQNQSYIRLAPRYGGHFWNVRV